MALALQIPTQNTGARQILQREFANLLQVKTVLRIFKEDSANFLQFYNFTNTYLDDINAKG